jgi:hypothetical protein
VKAGLKPPPEDCGLVADPCPTADGGGRAGREAGRFEDEEVRPGGGG